MKFHELLNKYSNEQIIEGLNTNYKDINSEAYISALTELRNITPSTDKQDTTINVEFTKDDFDEEDIDYLECDGIGLDENGVIIRWGLDFCEWKDWLAMDIDKDCLQKLNEITILAGILFEITFYGYSACDIVDNKNDILDRKKEAEEHPENLVKLDLDELENKLDEE